MKERGILFNGEMVRAILDGRKTETRRPLKVQPESIDNEKNIIIPYNGSGKFLQSNIKCPFGEVGDRIYVRETAIISPANWCSREESSHPDAPGGPRMVQYLATDPDRDAANDYGLTKATPSIHMPRWASRITLEITEIRVERVQDIDDSGCISEGISEPEIFKGYIEGGVAMDGIAAERYLFKELWDSVYKNWDDNVWVWVVKFKIHDTP